MAAPSWAAGGHVLPARARVHGVSLIEAAGRIAFFTTSGNDPAFLPRVPFQILHVAPGQGQAVSVRGRL